MLFYRRAFKAASLDGPEKLYKLRVPKGLRELPLELRDGIENDFVFCEIDGSADGFCPDPSTALSTSALRYTLRRVGEITGFATHVSPYSFRYGAAKALNDSRKQFPHILAGNPLRADRNVTLISPRLGTAAEYDSPTSKQ